MCLLTLTKLIVIYKRKKTFQIKLSSFSVKSLTQKMKIYTTMSFPFQTLAEWRFLPLVCYLTALITVLKTFNNLWWNPSPKYLYNSKFISSLLRAWPFFFFKFCSSISSSRIAFHYLSAHSCLRFILTNSFMSLYTSFNCLCLVFLWKYLILDVEQNAGFPYNFTFSVSVECRIPFKDISLTFVTSVQPLLVPFLLSSVSGVNLIFGP
jgi:hypothetical protein